MVVSIAEASPAALCRWCFHSLSGINTVCPSMRICRPALFRIVIRLDGTSSSWGSAVRLCVRLVAVLSSTIQSLRHSWKEPWTEKDDCFLDRFLRRAVGWRFHARLHPWTGWKLYVQLQRPRPRWWLAHRRSRKRLPPPANSFGRLRSRC
jgi:hypothetical protein